jgi:NADH-quinone oxidoreductase subunit C
MDRETLLQAVIAAEPEAKAVEKSEPPAVEVPAGRLLALLTALKGDPALGFDFLVDHMAIDWLEQNQFELAYMLQSLSHGHVLRVSARVARDNPVIPTVSRLWPIGEWLEREVYDLMGVLYDGHPDLRRLFLEDDWQGFPLRRDYKDDFMLEKPE